MKRALILSGGGAKGAFQFGVIQYIYEVIKKENPSFDFKIIAGVSVGALNSVMLAMDKYHELQKIWTTISNDQVYKGQLKTLSAIFKIILGNKSVLSNKPLQDKLRHYVKLNDVKTEKYDLRIGAVSLITGQYISFKPTDFDNDEDFQYAVLASTAMPIIWEPIEKIRTKNNISYEQLIDGGVRNVSPLGDVINDDPEEVVIINCSSGKMDIDPHAADNIFKIAKRSLTDITIDEIFLSDLREFIRINDIVKQAEKHRIQLKKLDGKPYKSFRTVLIQPDEDLGDTLDFSQSSIKSRMQKGYDAAKRAFQHPPIPFT